MAKKKKKQIVVTGEAHKRISIVANATGMKLCDLASGILLAWADGKSFTPGDSIAMQVKEAGK